MYARRQTRPKPRIAQSFKFPAPTAGWVSNRALSSPQSVEGPGAIVLDDFFPTAGGVVLRRGKELYGTLNPDLPVVSLFPYNNGFGEQFFGADDGAIYDLSNVTDPLAPPATVGTGYTSGLWSVVQIATTGGIYLVGVNGEDEGFIYDGELFYPHIPGGVFRLDYDGETYAPSMDSDLLTMDSLLDTFDMQPIPFLPGDILTGGTSGATATIWRAFDYGLTGRLYLRDISGTFQIDEPLTATSGGSATANSAASLAAPGLTFGDLTSANMSSVWVYKNRLWFTETGTLNAWYLDVDSIGGTATAFPLGGVFANGGALVFGQRWSLESGGDGGLSEQCIFVTSTGEVAVYQGISPADAATWTLAGVYRIGEPLGNRAYMRAGGDLAIATTAGLVPLSKAISLDVSALSVATVSYKIADAWTEALALRGKANWQTVIWPEQKMAAISPPDMIGGSEPVLFVTNTETGAWARYRNWMALSMSVYRGQMYFGSVDGKVYKAHVGGNDEGLPFTGAVVPLFDDLGTSGSLKIGQVARARTRSTLPTAGQISLLTDYDISLPVAPDASQGLGSNTWGDASWGASVWGGSKAAVVNLQWESVSGMGYSLAPCYQITSGSVVGLDVELIDMEIVFTTAELVT